MKYKIKNDGLIYSSHYMAYNYALKLYNKVNLQFLIKKCVNYENLLTDKFNRVGVFTQGDTVELISKFREEDFTNEVSCNSNVTFAHVRYSNGKNLIIDYDGLEPMWGLVKKPRVQYVYLKNLFSL